MNINLRHWKIEDAKALSMLLNNKKILDNVRDGLPYPYNEKDAKDYIEFMLSSDKNKNFSFAIAFDNKVVGNIGIFRKENIHYRTGELGYYISENYWGKGIGMEATKQICKYVFSNTDIIRIFAEPFSTNIASCKVLEKSGFQLEGIMRKNAEKNGKILDMKLYSIIKEI